MTKEKIRIGVVGAGATGGYLAAKLAKAGAKVTLLARGRSLETIRERGITLHTAEGTEIGKPAAVVATGERSQPVDVVLCCVKSYDTDEAARQMQGLVGRGGRVLCLQNGVVNETTLSNYFPRENIMSGVMYIGAERTAPGVIKCHTPARILFGPTHEGNAALAQRLKSAFDTAGIECTIEDNIVRSKWQKFLFNCGLNPLTAVTAMRLGSLIDSPEGARLFGALVDETIAVARALGAPIADDAREKVWEVARRMNISSSMAEDLAAGRPIELDAFTGFVVEHGWRLNVATPVSRVFYDLLSLRNPAERSDGGR